VDVPPNLNPADSEDHDVNNIEYKYSLQSLFVRIETGAQLRVPVEGRTAWEASDP
jgi:hypothetical protein